MDYLTGVIGDVTAEQADFEWDGDRVPVKLSKIAAIVFYHAKPANLPEASVQGVAGRRLASSSRDRRRSKASN